MAKLPSDCRDAVEAALVADVTDAALRRAMIDHHRFLVFRKKTAKQISANAAKYEARSSKKP